MSPYQVLLFYKYITIENPKALAEWVRTRSQELGFTGRILIAEEGINATVEGEVSNTELFAQEILANPLFSDVQIKRSAGDGWSFPKLSVKVRDEIVGTRFPREQADPRVRTSPHLSAEELKTLYENNDDFVVIDMRNDYEYASGHFKDSVNPGLQNSRDLIDKLPQLAQYKKKKVVTVCTGGIRCEKMSALLLSNGFEDVSQLDNGMHGYMEKYPGEDFLGTLYTFDQRHTMHFGGNREVVGTCQLCGTTTERYVDCANLNCHIHFIACERCSDDAGNTFCTVECKELVRKQLV